MSEAPGPTELATTQLLPYLAVGGNEEAWRAFVVRYRPRILRWCRRLQADDAEEVASRVLHKLVVGLARGVYRRHDPGTFRGWLRRVVGNEVVDFARRQRSGPAGRRRPAVLARPRQHRRTGRRTRRGVPGRLRARRAGLCPRPRPGATAHLGGLHPDVPPGPGGPRGGSRARPDALGRVQGPRSGPPAAGRGRAG